MGVLITIYNSIFGVANFGEDKFGRLEVEVETDNAFKKNLRKLFYKDSIDKTFLKNIRNTFYK